MSMHIAQTHGTRMDIEKTKSVELINFIWSICNSFFINEYSVPLKAFFPLIVIYLVRAIYEVGGYLVHSKKKIADNLYKIV